MTNSQGGSFTDPFRLVSQIPESLERCSHSAYCRRLRQKPGHSVFDELCISGHSGGHWSGGHWGGGHWSGGHWRGSFGVFVGAPLFWWGWPGYYDPYYSYGPYYGPPVVYREREVVPYPEGEMSPPVTEGARPGPGAPAQGPLYMNYCESARAYYPKVTSCPEGWKFVAPQR